MNDEIMIGLKTFSCACLLLSLALPAAGQVRISNDYLQTFATCAGRLTAQMQHQWLVSDPAADRTEAERAAMIDLLEAVQPDGAGREVLSHRLAARQAHAALLTRATFNKNAKDAQWAQRRATAEISQCLALMTR